MILLVNLSLSEPSDEDWCSIPDNLQNLGWWEFRNIDFHVCIPVVSSPSIHSADDSNDIELRKVQPSSEEDCTESIHLRSANISFMFIMNPILIEPVINRGFEIDVIPEIARSRCSGEELSFFRH